MCQTNGVTFAKLAVSIFSWKLLFVICNFCWNGVWNHRPTKTVFLFHLFTKFIFLFSDHSSVLSAKRHSNEKNNWRYTSSFTPAKSGTFVKNVEKVCIVVKNNISLVRIRLVHSRSIENILEKNNVDKVCSVFILKGCYQTKVMQKRLNF